MRNNSQNRRSVRFLPILMLIGAAALLPACAGGYANPSMAKKGEEQKMAKSESGEKMMKSESKESMAKSETMVKSGDDSMMKSGDGTMKKY